MRITKLDGLRGIFSLMVVVYHYPVQYLPDFVHGFFIVAKSHLFVDFFFVLSGFVISLNYDNLINTNRELITFIQKRFIRLYPLLLYSTVLFFMLQIGVKVFLPSIAANSDSFLPAILATVDTLLFLNSTPGITNSFGMNYPSWSISAEMIAYVFFGFVLLWGGKRKSIILIITIIAGMAFLVILDHEGNKDNYQFVRGLISFNIGYFVYRFTRTEVRLRAWVEYVTLAAFIGILFLAWRMEDTEYKGVMEACVIPLFFGSAIYAFICSDGLISRGLDTRAFQFLGKVSYSVYLNHALVLAVIPLGAFSVLKLPTTVSTELGVFCIVITFVILYSHYTYHIVEVNGGKLLKRLMLGNKPATQPVSASKL